MKILNNTLLAAIFTSCAFCSNYSAAQSNEVPFTQEDRDRLIRLEIKVEAIDKRFDDINNRIDEIRTDMRNQFN